MDLSLCELIQAAARDHPSALSCRTLWACDPILDAPIACPAGLQLPQVIRALRREAMLRNSASGLSLA